MMRPLFYYDEGYKPQVELLEDLKCFDYDGDWIVVYTLCLLDDDAYYHRVFEVTVLANKAYADGQIRVQRMDAVVEEDTYHYVIVQQTMLLSYKME